MARTWVRVRNAVGHEFDRPDNDPRIGKTLHLVEGYPTATEPRRAKHRTDKAGRPITQSPADDDGPKGKALDAALKKAGLPTTGTAADKRQRLADHLAGTGASEDDLPTNDDRGDD